MEAEDPDKGVERGVERGLARPGAAAGNPPGVAIESLVRGRRQRPPSQRARRDDGPMAEVWKALRPDSRADELTERQQWRAATIQIIKEQERARIARELHDDLGGTLAAIKIELARLRNRLHKGAKPADLEERIGLLESLVDEAFSSARQVSGDLRPALLDLGIFGAITWLATEFEERSGIPCMVDVVPADIHGGEALVLALARIVQEALTNVSKHAQANLVEIRGRVDSGTLHLTVRDDGRGFNPTELDKSQSFGVRGIRERARALGGDAFILSDAEGTTVSVRLPFESDGAARGFTGSTLPTGAAP